MATPGYRDARSVVHKWVGFGVFERVQAQIDVQVRPMQMVSREELYVEDVMDARLAEPREILVGEEVLFVMDKEPETATVNMRHRRTHAFEC